jgi:hypothetical protein
MSGNIVKLTGHALPGEVDADLVQVAQDLLDRIKRGEITAMAWALVSPNDDTHTGWEGAGGTRYALASAIMCLQWRYAAGLNGDGE